MVEAVEHLKTSPVLDAGELARVWFDELSSSPS